jgi:hypothetical protein
MSGLRKRRSAKRAANSLQRHEPLNPRPEEIGSPAFHDENPSVPGHPAAEDVPPYTPTPADEDGASSCPAPRPLERPVSLKGRMTEDGKLPENWEWWDELTTPSRKGGRRRYGRNPMSIPPEVLTAAGHPPRRTRAILSALGDEPIIHEIRGYKDLRQHCLACSSGSKAAVRCCAIIDCPLWPYRMGRNPHNKRRGRNPFAKKQ